VKPGKRAARLASAPPVAGGPPEKSALGLAPDLLARLASSLNDCELAGLPVQLAHGAVITDAGYVLHIVLPHEPGFAGDLWQIRTRQLTEFPQAAGDDDDFDG
jgi:hypothetical protein